MITFSRLGNYGRLGNQMFQYASIIGIAKKNNFDYCFPLTGTEISKWFNLTANNKAVQKKQLELHKFSFDPRLFQLPDDLDYFTAYGYFGDLQTEKYFEHCKDFIRKEYSFKETVTEIVDKWFSEQEEYVSVHVRRTDYLNISDIHRTLPLDWYHEAMNYFPGKKFLIFSDDLNWCKQTFPEHEFSPFENEGEDMYAMTKCKGHIIANSSFSWWGAWLGKGKTIAPKTWFGPHGPQDWQDIYCSDWVIL